MDEKEASLSIHHESAPPPQALPALGEVFAQARAAGLTAACVTHSAAPEARRHLAKRRHDIKAALRTLSFTVKALESGYTFQDDKAAAKIDAIAKAVLVLEREGAVLGDILGLEGGG